jgi:hypothetical protein
MENGRKVLTVNYFYDSTSNISKMFMPEDKPDIDDLIAEFLKENVSQHKISSNQNVSFYNFFQISYISVLVNFREQRENE